MTDDAKLEEAEPRPPTRGWILEQIAKVSEEQRGKAPWRKVPPLGDAPDPVPALEAPAPPAVGSRGTHRGHPMLLVGDVWCYADTREPVADNPTRPCGHCSMPNRADGHDACLGVIPGAMNACCGHGDEAARYVQVDPEPPITACSVCGDNDPEVPCDHGGEATREEGLKPMPDALKDVLEAASDADIGGDFTLAQSNATRTACHALYTKAHAAGRAERDAEWREPLGRLVNVFKSKAYKREVFAEHTSDFRQAAMDLHVTLSKLPEAE